jgi:hypothetical protein
MPSRSAASKASRSVTTKVAPTAGYSAMIRPLAVFSWYSPTKG